MHYLGSVCENNKFKFFIERVPGRNVSKLLSSKWDPLSKLKFSILAHQNDSVV